MPGPIQSIERAAAVLRLLVSAGQGLGVVEVGNALGLAKTTAHGILRTLVEVGLVDQDDRGDYRASPGLADLGRPRIDANDLRAQAANCTDSLAGRTGKTTRLAVPSGDRALVVHHVFRPDDSAQALTTGTSLPAHACALGPAPPAAPRADGRTASPPPTRR